MKIAETARNWKIFQKTKSNQRKNDEFTTNSTRKLKKITRESARKRKKKRENASEKLVTDRNKLSLQRELLIPYYETVKMKK
jgi:hypothetical protein